MIRYVQEKYGRDHVAQIITFGKLQPARCCEMLGGSLRCLTGISTKSANGSKQSGQSGQLPEAIAREPQLRELINEDPDVRRLTDMAKQLEGLYRHASTHAAGVVIGDRPLDKLIPLYRDPRSDMPVTGFNMKSVESAGLVKFDFLGLKTLTVLVTAEKLVREKGGNIDLAMLPLDNQATFDMISRGETAAYSSWKAWHGRCP